jgi:acyl carrier protein
MNDVETIRRDITGMLIDVLGVDEGEVVPSARFFQDLDGESIDVLDLSFRCEQHYGKKIPFQQFAADDSVTTDEDCRLTRESLEALKHRYPFLDLSSLGGEPKRESLTELFTVDAIVNFTAWTLDVRESSDDFILR